MKRGLVQSQERIVLISRCLAKENPCRFSEAIAECVINGVTNAIVKSLPWATRVTGVFL